MFRNEEDKKKRRKEGVEEVSRREEQKRKQAQDERKRKEEEERKIRDKKRLEEKERRRRANERNDRKKREEEKKAYNIRKEEEKKQKEEKRKEEEQKRKERSTGKAEKNEWKVNEKEKEGDERKEMKYKTKDESAKKKGNDARDKKPAKTVVNNTKEEKKRKNEKKGEKTKKKIKLDSSGAEEGSKTKCCNRQFDDSFQCPCEVNVPDKIILNCTICKGRDHGWCYGVFVMTADFVHVCARCSIQTGLACTSEEIKLWVLTDFKSEEDKTEFKMGLLKKRAIFSYAEKEYMGYSGCNPPYGKYIEGRFSQGKKMAETIVGKIVLEGCIAQMNTPFMINLHQIKKSYGYVPIDNGKVKVAETRKERNQSNKVEIVYPPPSMNVPPPMAMTAHPPPVVLDFSVAPPSYRREENKPIYRDGNKWSYSGETLAETSIGMGPQYGRQEDNLKPFKRKAEERSKFEDSGFDAPEDYDGNSAFKRKKQLMDIEDTTQIGEDEVKTDRNTGAQYTEHLIFERRHFFRTRDGRMLMPRPIECVNTKNERISLCGELTELRELRRNGKGDSFNIQMVFSRNGAQLAAVAFPPNDEPDGRRFAENLEEGRYYVLQKYTVGDSSRSPMKNNMAENVILDWRHPIEEVPFEKIMLNSRTSQEQRSFNREFQEAGPGKARPTVYVGQNGGSFLPPPRPPDSFFQFFFVLRYFLLSLKCVQEVTAL